MHIRTWSRVSLPVLPQVLGHKASEGLASASTTDLVRHESLPFVPYGAKSEDSLTMLPCVVDIPFVHLNRAVSPLSQLPPPV